MKVLFCDCDLPCTDRSINCYASTRPSSQLQDVIWLLVIGGVIVAWCRNGRRWIDVRQLKNSDVVVSRMSIEKLLWKISSGSTLRADVPFISRTHLPRSDGLDKRWDARHKYTMACLHHQTSHQDILLTQAPQIVRQMGLKTTCDKRPTGITTGKEAVGTSRSIDLPSRRDVVDPAQDRELLVFY